MCGRNSVVSFREFTIDAWSNSVCLEILPGNSQPRRHRMLFSVPTPSDLSYIELHHQHPLPSSPHTHADTSRFTSPCYAWRGAVGPTTSVLCGFIPSLPVIAYVIPWITQQTTPPGCTEIAESTSLEVAPILPTPAIFPSSRPTRSLRRSKSSSLPDSNYYLNRRHRNLAIMNRNIDS